MNKLKGFQKKYLKGLAHNMKPVIFIGQKGITDTVIQSINDALNKHELIKLKFIEFKEKDQKNEIVEIIEKQNRCECIGMIGHISILYRQHHDPKKRTITVPKSS